MNTPYTINFRREAFLLEVAKARRRAFRLGLWLSYCGALGILMGLYGINLASMVKRVAVVERQVERLRQRPAAEDNWRPSPAEVTEIVRLLGDTRRWRDRLARLPVVLPPNAILSSLQLNPESASGNTDPKLIVSGEMRGGAGEGRVQQVMSFVNVLSHDSTFASGYRNIRLVTTRATTNGDGAEFVIECR